MWILALAWELLQCSVSVSVLNMLALLTAVPLHDAAGCG